MDGGITIIFHNWAQRREPEALRPNTKSISKAFRITCYYLMLKEFFTSSSMLWESHLHHRKFLNLVKVTVLSPKQNRTKTKLWSETSLWGSAQCSVAKNASSPCVWHQNTRVLEEGELMPVTEASPTPILGCLETGLELTQNRGDGRNGPHLQWGWEVAPRTLNPSKSLTFTVNLHPAATKATI